MTTAKLYFEAEVEILGTFQKGYPARGPSYASGGEPGEPSGFEDVSVEGLFALKRPNIGGDWVSVNLLKGIDVKSPGAKLVLEQLFENILDFIGVEDADLALLAELGED